MSNIECEANNITMLEKYIQKQDTYEQLILVKEVLALR